MTLRASHISELMASLTPRALARAAVSDETMELGIGLVEGQQLGDLPGVGAARRRASSGAGRRMARASAAGLGAGVRAPPP